MSTVAKGLLFISWNIVSFFEAAEKNKIRNDQKPVKLKVKYMFFYCVSISPGLFFTSAFKFRFTM